MVSVGDGGVFFCPYLWDAHSACFSADISEYGTPLRPVSGDDAFLAEHYEALVSGNAVHALAGSVS